LNKRDKYRDRIKRQGKEVKKKREMWVKEWIKEKLEVECNIITVRKSGSVHVVKIEREEQKKEIMKNKHKLRSERIFIENHLRRKGKFKKK